MSTKPAGSLPPVGGSNNMDVSIEMHETAEEAETTQYPGSKSTESPIASETPRAPEPNTVEQPLLEAQRKPSVHNDKPSSADPYTRGLEIGADVWNTYVKEADKSDKELSDGWNKMLDVILLFAALFSAISTAFVLESSKGLKPDPAESSAARLLTITQLLVAMSNQSTTTTITLPPDDSAFSPSTSAVAVNVLWFLSLILSVAVTLVAMLAKEWCHLFMAGRDGNMHDQARKRQLRLEGLKHWKMEGIIPALPTLMHLALFLFAVGLCIYLWNIHIGVAIPVILISASAGVLYLSAIILPFIHDFCPYETALSKQIKPWARACFHAWFGPGHPDSPEKSNHSVPMDDLTTRVLIWLISSCENPKAVDVALQSIAGADHNLPFRRLWESHAVQLIVSRIEDCFSAHQLSAERDLTRVRELSPERYNSVMAYAKSLSVLVFQSEYLNEIYDTSSEKFSDSTGRRTLFQFCGLSEPFRLISTSQRLHGALSGYNALMHDLVDSLPGLIAVQGRTPSALPPSETRLGMLQETLKLISSTAVDNIEETSIARFLTVVSLRLNNHLLAHFETADTSLSSLFDNHPAASEQHQCAMIEDLSLNYSMVLGLTGLVEASGHSECAGAVVPNDMSTVFERLLKQGINQNYFSASAPPISTNTFDLRRYALETVFNYYNRELASDLTSSQSTCFGLLRSLLVSRWSDVPRIAGLVLNTLAGSSSGEMRDIVARFLCWNSEPVSRHPHVYNILYEIVRKSKQEPLSYFDLYHCEHLYDITYNLHNIATANGGDPNCIEGTVDAFLERITNNNLLLNLMLCAYGSDQRWLEDDLWQGIRFRATSFWSEKIIALAQKSKAQQATSNSPGSSAMAGRIRTFCLTPSDLPIETNSGNETGGGGMGSMAVDERVRAWKRAREEEMQKNLRQLKTTILQKMGESLNQPAPSDRPHKQPIENVQPPANGQLGEQSHISIPSPVVATTGDTPTPIASIQ